MNAWVALGGLIAEEPTTVCLVVSDFRGWLETSFEKLEIRCDECSDTCVWLCKMCNGSGVGVDGSPICAICDGEPVQVCLCDDEPRQVQIANVLDVRVERAKLLRHVQKVHDEIVSACVQNGTLYVGELAIEPYRTSSEDVVVEERAYAHEQLLLRGLT